MGEAELRLLNDFQRGFPLRPDPWGELAHALGWSEEQVLARIADLKSRGMVSRVGAVFRPRTVGASTLAAMAVPAARLEQVAQAVSASPHVNHNYQREHRCNLWFVATAADERQLGEVLAGIEAAAGHPVMSLPLLEDYHIDLGFDLHGGCGARRDRGHGPAAPVALDARQRRLVAALQPGLPLVPRPYAALGAAAGMSEDQVITQIARWEEDGVIRRFGVVVRHHELGWNANAMVVWDVPDAQVDAAGREIARHDFVTLCYRRPRRLPDWRYNLFCMIHGRDRATVLAQIERLAALPWLAGCAHEPLFSLRRYKQTGARYAAAA